jgi:hypothetical protein
MELLSTLIVVASIIGIAWLYFKSIISLNKWCETMYGYRPITLGKCFIASLPIILVFIGAIMDGRNSGGLNVIVAGILGLVIIAWLWFRIFSQTSFLESLGAITLLIINGTLIFLVIFIAIALYIESQKRKKVVIKID